MPPRINSEHEGTKNFLLSSFSDLFFMFQAKPSYLKDFTHTHTHTYIYIYIYVYIWVLCMSLNCIRWWGSSPEIWWMCSNPSVTLLTGPLFPRVVVLFRLPSLGQNRTVQSFNKGYIYYPFEPTQLCANCLYVIDRNTW